MPCIVFHRKIDCQYAYIDHNQQANASVFVQKSRGVDETFDSLGDTYLKQSRPLDRGPYFDTSATKNVTSLVGKTAHLNCRIKNLGNKTVSNNNCQQMGIEPSGGKIKCIYAYMMYWQQIAVGIIFTVLKKLISF